MKVHATLQLSDGRTLEVGHGDIVGRLWHAAVHIDDPRISEAHALVSLRMGELRLLALRGRFAVGGRLVAETVLRPGLRVALADGIALEVLAVDLPSRVLGLRTEGMPDRAIPGTCALVHAPAPALAPPTDPHAVAWVWRAPDRWRLRVAGEVDRDLSPGDTVVLEGRVWEAVDIDVHGTVDPTRLDPSMARPMRMVTRYTSVHLFRDGAEPVVLRGLSARLVSELVAFGCPVPWSMLAAELWDDGGSRKQFDMAMVRLRAQLREGRVRSDLVRTDGHGSVELLLRPGDEVEDAS